MVRLPLLRGGSAAAFTHLVFHLPEWYIRPFPTHHLPLPSPEEHMRPRPVCAQPQPEDPIGALGDEVGAGLSFASVTMPDLFSESSQVKCIYTGTHQLVPMCTRTR